MILTMNLIVHTERLTIVRLNPDAPIPAWAVGSFLSMTRTERELSIVCREELVPADLNCSRSWRRLSVEGVLNFSLTGILASLTGPLAAAGIPIFAISTYETDHLLVKDEQLDAVVAVLSAAGHRMIIPEEK